MITNCVRSEGFDDKVGEQRHGVGMQSKLRLLHADERGRRWVQQGRQHCNESDGAV